MKKLLTFLVTLVLLATNFVIPALASDVVTLTFWDENAGPNRTPYLEELIARFEAANPDIVVEYVGLPWSDSKSKYDVAIQSNTTPDVGGVAQSWLCDFVVKGALLPIDEYYENWAAKDDMVEAYIASMRATAPDGKLYGINNTANIPVIWYRSDRIAEPKTWDDVFAEAEASADVANGIYGFSIRGGGYGPGSLEQMMYSYSGITEMFDEQGKSTVNNPYHIEFVEKLAGMYNRITPESDITNGYKEMVAAFDTGMANMIFHNLGSYGEHMKTLGEGKFAAATAMKSVLGTSNVVTNGSIAYSIFKTCQHPEEAFRFLSWLCEAEQSLYWNENIGQLPTTKTALESDYCKSAQHIASAAATTGDPTTTVVSTPIQVSGYADLLKEMEPKFQQVLMGDLSAEAFLTEWADGMTALKAEFDAFIAQ